MTIVVASMSVPELAQELVKMHGSGNAAARACRMPEGTFHRILSGEHQDPRLSTLRCFARGFDEPLHKTLRRLGDGRPVGG